MSVISLPYLYATGNLGTHSYVYNWSTTSGYMTYYYDNTVKLTPSANITINSFTVEDDSDVARANISIDAPTSVIRSGSNPGNWTATGKPTIKLYNVNLGSTITLYDTSLSITVAYNGSGTIVHKVTKDITIPLTWFSEENSEWRIDISYFVFCGSNTTYTKSSDNFTVDFNVNKFGPNISKITVKYKGNLCEATKITTKHEGVLSALDKLKVIFNGKLL